MATSSHPTIERPEQEGDGCTDLILLETGNYDISEVLGGNWYAIEPENGATTTAIIADETITVDFYNAEYGSISGYKYEDNDLASSTNELLPKEGWIIDLAYTVDLGTSIVSTTTDVDGYYKFSNLVPGGYTIIEDMPAGWEAVGSSSLDVIILSGVNLEENNFINHYEAPSTYCGDGIVNNSEQCDDGNNQENDGCSSVCTNESGGGGHVKIAGTPAPIVLGQEGEPVLTIDKSVNLNFVNPGDEIEYTVVITNTGNLTAFDVVLNDVLPEWFTFVDGGGSNKIWNLGDIEPSHNKTTIYTVLVGDEVNNGIYANLAEASASNHNPVMDSTDIEIREIEVLGVELAPTGFSVKEFLLIIALILTFSGLAVIIRRRIKV